MAFDHAGFALTGKLRQSLAAEGQADCQAEAHELVDFGTGAGKSCGYVECALPVSRAAQGCFDRAILVSSTDRGMALEAH